MAGWEGKRAFICISSSSEEEEDDDSDQVEDSGTEEEEDDGDDEDDEGDDYDDEQIEEGDDEALSNKVIRSLKGSSFFLFSLRIFFFGVFYFHSHFSVSNVDASFNCR